MNVSCSFRFLPGVYKSSYLNMIKNPINPFNERNLFKQNIKKLFAMAPLVPLILSPKKSKAVDKEYKTGLLYSREKNLPFLEDSEDSEDHKNIEDQLEILSNLKQDPKDIPVDLVDPLDPVEPLNLSNLPNKIDLTEYFPPVFEQGKLASCAANAIVAAVMCQIAKQNSTMTSLKSRLFLYWQQRYIEGTIETDAGSYIIDGIISLLTHGVCQESMWPYDSNTFSYFPFPEMSKDALNCKIECLSSRMTTFDNLNFDHTSAVAHDKILIKYLLNRQIPVIAGIAVYNSFVTQGKNGYITVPNLNNEEINEYHAVVITGYDDDIMIGNYRGAFKIRNSWGPDWGIKGSAWISYECFHPHLFLELWKIGKLYLN